MSDIKVFVCNTCGAENEQIGDSMYQPIYGGKALAAGKKLDPKIPGDDTGDNISDMNRSYCELTVQYWAWKNVKSDYYGFCHYRRYFGFTGDKKDRDIYCNIIEDYINPRTIKKYGIGEEAARKVIESADIVVTDPVNVLMMPECYTSIRDHYERACSLNVKDVDLLLDIIKEVSPEYSETANEYFDGVVGYFCNMFVMKKELFNTYCEWLFKVLAEFDKRSDMSRYSIEGFRTPGHLAERLCGIFINHQKKINPSVKVKEVRCVLFRHPQLSKPLEKPAKDNLVPVVFAANDNFVGPLGVAVKSLLLHASSNHFYDIVVLESDITVQNKRMLTKMVSEYENAQVRFCSALPFLEGYTLIPHAHISKETFFRFLIQGVMPDYEKVLYLDGDIVIQDDVADLYDTDVTGNMLAAVHDVDFASQINGFDPRMMKYAKKKLRMKDPYQYFQAGVLLLNLTEMRKAHTLEEWLELASVDYKYSDQDVLNINCEGKVVYLPQEWNLIFDNDFSRVSTVLRFAPRDLRMIYDKAALNPKIIHYAGIGKPWAHLPADRYAEFWSVARQTPFYELLYYNMLIGQGRTMAFQTLHDHLYHKHRAVATRAGEGTKNFFGKCANGLVGCILPDGSARRESLQMKWRTRVMKKVAIEKAKAEAEFEKSLVETPNTKSSK